MANPFDPLYDDDINNNNNSNNNNNNNNDLTNKSTKLKQNDSGFKMVLTTNDNNTNDINLNDNNGNNSNKVSMKSAYSPTGILLLLSPKYIYFYLYYINYL